MLPAAATYLLQDKDNAAQSTVSILSYYIIIYEIGIFQVFATYIITKNLASRRGTQNEAHHDYMQSQEVSIQSGKGGRERRIQPKF